MAEYQTLQALIRSLGRRGDRPAVFALHKQDSGTLSYEDLARDAGQLAAGLTQRGLEQGQHVALLAANSPAWLAVALGIIDAGGVIVPIDVQASDENLAHILTDSEPRWIFTTSDLAERLDQVKKLKHRPEVFLLDQDQDKRSWRRVLSDEDFEAPKLRPDDPAVLFYTSGTTGPPKGVPLTHANIASNLSAILAQDIAHENDRLILPLPLHHVYPFTLGLLAPLALGATIVMPHSLTGPQVLRALSEGKVTVMVGVPRFYEALYAAVETGVRERGGIARLVFRAAMGLAVFSRRAFRLPLGRWLFTPLRRRFAPQVRLIASGGAAMDAALARKLDALGFAVTTGYGLTETSPILTFLPPGSGRFTTAGKPLPGVEIRIAEPEEGQKHGEVQAKGPNVFAGYHNLPDKNQETFTDDGWFRTGDLGFLDRRGYLHLVGRASSMIVRPGGENVKPEDVEEALERGERIREAGVLQKDGDLVAVLVAAPGATREGEDLQKLLRRDVQQASRALASYQRISDYAVSPDPLPRTRLGKLQRHELEEIFERAKRAGPKAAEERGPVPIERLSQEDQQLLRAPAARQVWDWLAQRFPDVRLTPDVSPQVDLGVDSMQWLNLTLEMRERAGVDLPDEAVGRVETVRDLLREATEASDAQGGGDPIELLRAAEDQLDEEQQRWRAPPNAAWRGAGRVVYALDWALMRSVFRLKVDGAEHLPARGPVLIVPNHASLLDPPALAAALGRRRLEQTCWAGWTGIMFRNPLMRALSRAMRVLPVDPRRGAIASLALAAAALKRGQSLVWFAEAERSPTGELLPFRPGVGMLLQAQDQPVPAVPVWIGGGHEALPRGALLPRPHRMHVRIGAPADAATLEREGHGESPAERVADALHQRVADLAPRHHRPKGRRGGPSKKARRHQGPGHGKPRAA